MNNSTRYLINSSGNHTIQICPTENSKIDQVTRYIKEGLINNEAIFIVSEPPLRKILRSKMDGLTFDGQSFQGPNQVRFFDAAFLLLTLKSYDNLEEEAFQENVATPMHNSRPEYKKARAFEEMANMLYKQEQHGMAIQTSCFFKSLANIQEFSILCSYSLDHVDLDSYDKTLEQICRYHPDSTPQRHYGSTEQGIDKSMNALGAAWGRLSDKLIH